jgi:plastocyanin
MRLLCAAILAAVSPALAGCGGSGESTASSSASSGGAAVEIAMKSVAFAPEAASVEVGQTVRWTNEDDVDHNVIADSGARFTSRDFGRDGTFEFKATKAGTVRYECTLHPGMKATLTVK